MGQSTHDGEYSGNESGLSRVNKTDSGSYKDDALDDAYHNDMPAIFAIGPRGDGRFVARNSFYCFAFRIRM